jgi:hypothetical protein
LQYKVVNTKSIVEIECYVCNTKASEKSNFSGGIRALSHKVNAAGFACRLQLFLRFETDKSRRLSKARLISKKFGGDWL